VSDLTNSKKNVHGLLVNKKKVKHRQEPGMKKADYYSISTSDNHVNNRDKPYERLYKFDDHDY
jgi:hypothetical protein